MKTDVIVVSSRGNRMEAALHEVEKVAAYQDLTGKNALHLRLLTEEMMGMMRSITGETSGEFWIENDGPQYELHLRVETPMNYDKREQLLSVSSTGKNEAARGLMGWIRDFFAVGEDEDVMRTSPLMMYDEYHSTATALEWEWSMSRYQDSLNTYRGKDSKAREMWDELEKSVVTKVADDVKVSIRGRCVELIILKKLA